MRALIMVPPLLIAMILHEIAHALVAERLGDPTARNQGRVTLNPLKHIDPFMTVILPGIMLLTHMPFVFGGAKPVPVDPRNFSDPRRGMGWVALAGPITNFVLAGVSALLLRLFWEADLGELLPAAVGEVVILWLIWSAVINISLGFFNLFPVPPLDGGRIVTALLPIDLARRYAKLERHGILIVMVLLYFDVVGAVLVPLIEYSLGILGIGDGL